MCSAIAIEVGSLREKHPRFADLLLSRHAPPLLYRLGIDPEPPPPVGEQRNVLVSFIRCPGDAAACEVRCVVGWGSTNEEIKRTATTIGYTLPEQDANEDAAIGLMALLVSDLAGGVLHSVLSIGTSADYLIELASDGVLLPMEVSGIGTARSPGESVDRLRRKTRQLLTGHEAGYVSVSTFKHPSFDAVHSYLHYVKGQPPPKSRRKSGKMRRRGAPMSTEAAPKPAPNSAASVAALEGGSALLRGDTNLARRKYGAAGELLLKQSSAALKQQERHLGWYLAATQFFKGGDYRRAAQVASRIEAKFLPPHLRESFSAFVRQTQSRASEHYVQSTRRKMFELWRDGRHADLLRFLQEHPYVLDADGLAFLRAGLCERIGDFRAAAAFFSTAYRLRPHLEFVALAAGYLFYLTGQGQFKDAQAYADFLTAALPHPVIFAAASVVWLQTARLTPEDQREPLFEKQLSLFDRARAGFLRLPPGERSHPDVRTFIPLAYDAAAHALVWRGEEKAGAELTDEARQLWPEAADLWTTRGLATGSAQEGEPYFRRAVELGATGYVPYYFLALAALERGDYANALARARQALAHSTPQHKGAARLHAFLAGCIAESGGDWAEADRLFQRALELDPTDAEVREGYRRFREAGKPLPPRFQWPREEAAELAFLPDGEQQAKRMDRQMGRVLELATAN
jgi:tetratricopeptide (TPR) repeat protein